MHLTPAASFAIATRKHLDSRPPSCPRCCGRTLFGTIQSNKFGNMAQLSEGGDFEAIFSYTQKGLYDLLADTHREFDFGITDPYKDAESRRIDTGLFTTPTQTEPATTLRCFPRAHHAVCEPLLSRWAYAASCIGRRRLPAPTETRDTSHHGMAETLNKLIPHGTGYEPETFTRDDLSRLLARFIYLVTALHEMVGSALWNLSAVDPSAAGSSLSRTAGANRWMYISAW